MIKQFYKNRRFEEIMGLIGLLYFALLFLAGALLVQFLVHVTLSSLTPGTPPGSSIAQFGVPTAQDH